MKHKHVEEWKYTLSLDKICVINKPKFYYFSNWIIIKISFIHVLSKCLSIGSGTAIVISSDDDMPEPSF